MIGLYVRASLRGRPELRGTGALTEGRPYGMLS